MWKYGIHRKKHGCIPGEEDGTGVNFGPRQSWNSDFSPGSGVCISGERLCSQGRRWGSALEGELCALRCIPGRAAGGRKLGWADHASDVEA